MSLPSKLPDTVELCTQSRDGLYCLGTIYRMSPDQQPYCFRCGARDKGALYRLLGDHVEITMHGPASKPVHA